MRHIKSLLYYITVIVLVLYIVVLGTSPNQMMNIFGFRPFVVLSNSMDPTIKKNDLIFIKQAEIEDLEVGDIITFKVYIKEVEEVSFVTHYIGDIREIGNVTIFKTHAEGHEGEYDIWRDSNNNLIDITIEDIEGEFLFRIPYMGHVQQILSNKILVGAVIINVSLIYITYKYIKWKPKEDQEE